MEIVQKKAEPLDLDGVPEPLKGLIARMSDPNPDMRFQTAQETLGAFQAALRSSGTQSPAPSAANMIDDDATVIVPQRTVTPTSVPRGTAMPAQTQAPEPPKPAAPASAPAKKKSGVLVPLLLVGLLLIGGGGGAYFAGLFDSFLSPQYPLADPYTLIVEKKADQPPRAIGNVPSPEVADALTQVMSANGGAADLSLATGNISDTWGQDMMGIMQSAAGLDEYRVLISGNAVRVTGLANSKTVRTQAMQDLNAGLPASFTGGADILQGPRILEAESLLPLLDQYSDCGPLRLVAVPAFGYGLDDRIVVSGKLAGADSRTALQEAISSIAGNRAVGIEAEVLSQGLCQIEAALPLSPSGGFDILFENGRTGLPNNNGIYLVGENPVIDIMLPEEIQTGYLWVSVLDVSGNVFHLLPNLSRQENDIQTLRAEATDDGAVRVAYSISQAADNARLAFLVDDSTLGKSKIIAIYSDAPLFDTIRPTTESAASYAAALIAARETGGLGVKTLDSRVLVTTQ